LESQDLRLIGTPDDVIAKLTDLVEAGAEEVSIILPALSIPHLELFAREVMPAFSAPPHPPAP
jgi:alkanesulfonate monooxygenase SsuD/methylene tetrahydromethanopterin reductase-like flavin-dependent oxidoreductase (luciferase family)